ncbi:MAG: hypothetical protein SO128_08915 [Clostridium cadaveris]|nr:hypothetical protein [Clostridium cadaveris]MDY4949483.1 hypothetical protein [Clostridium cadaveris]
MGERVERIDNINRVKSLASCDFGCCKMSYFYQEKDLALKT